VLALAHRHGVEMPITEVMVAVVRDGLAVGEAAVAAWPAAAPSRRYGV